MKLLEKLERKFGFLAIHHLTLYIIVGQVLVFGLYLARGSDAARVIGTLIFSFDSFVNGEPWRVLTFLAIPKTFSPIFIIFSLYILHMMGSALEQHWGAFRYNLYFLTSVLGVVAASVFSPYSQIDNFYLLISISFAFAYLHPNIEFLIFFVLPVKVKWIAWLTFGVVVMEFARGDLALKLVILGSLANFPLFFGADFIRSLRSKKRVVELKAAKRKFETEPFHTCSRCGATDQTAPERDFRYRDDVALCSVCLEQDAEKSR